MKWPYHFVFGQTPDELAQRRYLLDYYARLAQYSGLVPVILLCSLRYIQKRANASSKAKDRRKNGFFARPGSMWRIFTWVSDEEIAPGWETRRQVVFAAVWGSWLAWCVVRKTGDGELRHYVCFKRTWFMRRL